MISDLIFGLCQKTVYFPYLPLFWSEYSFEEGKETNYVEMELMSANLDSFLEGKCH